jgi:hypothetical protein
MMRNTIAQIRQIGAGVQQVEQEWECNGMGRMQWARMTMNMSDVTTCKKWQGKKQRKEEA